MRERSDEASREQPAADVQERPLEPLPPRSAPTLTAEGVEGWLRAEGAAVVLASVALFAWFEGAWWLFALLLLAPDVAMLGYLAGPRVGALCYNLAHLYVGPLLLIAIGTAASIPWMYHVGFTWTAHIGLDRMLGYGLKLPTGFRDTHLGRIGRPDASEG